LVLWSNAKGKDGGGVHGYRHASRKAVFYKKTGVSRGAFYIKLPLVQDNYRERS